MLGDLEEVAEGGVAGVVTATGPLGTAGSGSALGPWAASAARDSWYSRHFLSRLLSPADRFSFPGDALLLLPCSVRSLPGSGKFFSSCPEWRR